MKYINLCFSFYNMVLFLFSVGVHKKYLDLFRFLFVCMNGDVYVCECVMKCSNIIDFSNAMVLGWHNRNLKTETK